MRSIGTGKMPGSDAPFRQELEASVPATLNSVLVFYRGELGKRGWQERRKAPSSKPDQVQLAFHLAGRTGDAETHAAATARPRSISPRNIRRSRQGRNGAEAGQSKLLFGNIGKSDATLSINKQTIKIALPAPADRNRQAPPMTDRSAAGAKHQHALKIPRAGRRAVKPVIEIGAGDTWGVMIGPGGDVLPLQMC